MPKKGQKLSEEQRAKAREALRKAHEARRAKAIAEGVQEDLAKAGLDRSEQQCLYCGVKFQADLLEEHQIAVHGGVIDPTKVGANAKVPTGKKPGEYYYPAKGVKLKVPYTWKYIRENFPFIRVVPPTSRNVTFQGVTLRLEAGVEQDVPEPFWYVYNDAITRARTAFSPNDTPYGPVRTGLGAQENEVYRLPGAGLSRGEE
jgi:hypothetical protein